MTEEFIFNAHLALDLITLVYARIRKFKDNKDRLSQEIVNRQERTSLNYRLN